MTQQRESGPGFGWRRGDTGPAVARIRRRLVRLALLPDETAGGTPPAAGSSSAAPFAVDDRSTAVFDDAVECAVRHFQQSRGLTADGVVGTETYRHLDEAGRRLGDRILSYQGTDRITGDDVARLQQRLLDLGFTPGKVDGIFGAATAHAVRDFQRNYGLRADGTFGPVTYRSLMQLSRAVTGGQPQTMRDMERLHRSGPALPGKVLVLDPGHGGSDPGVCAHGVTEADVVWDIAARLDERLAALGVRTYLTRGPDAGCDEAERARFANATDADLVISIHVDGHSGSSASGVATYYYGSDTHGRSSHTGRQFASLVRRELVTRCGLGDNRSHPRTWTLLRHTRMPAVRIELGYLTNPHDAERLLCPGFRADAVEAIAVALQRLYLPPEDDAPTGVLRLPSTLV